MSIWYVSTTGSDLTGNGSLNNPFLTISKCNTSVSDYDSIILLTGSYTINNTINIVRKITITSNNINTDVVLNSNCTIFNIQSSDWNISQKYTDVKLYHMDIGNITRKGRDRKKTSRKFEERKKERKRKKKGRNKKERKKGRKKQAKKQRKVTHIKFLVILAAQF